MSASHLVAKSCIFTEEHLDLLFVGINFLGRLAKFVSVVVELCAESLSLLRRQSDVLLGFLDLSSEGSDFVILLLNELIEPLDLVSHDSVLVL